MNSHCHHCSFEIMSIIKITEVLTGRVNNSSETSLQSLMASTFNGHSKSLKYVSARQGDTRSVPMERDGLSQTPTLWKRPSLFSDGNKYQVAHVVWRFETSGMKFSRQNLRVTASQTWKLYLLNVTLQGKKKKKKRLRILFLKGRRQLWVWENDLGRLPGHTHKRMRRNLTRWE